MDTLLVTAICASYGDVAAADADRRAMDMVLSLHEGSTGAGPWSAPAAVVIGRRADGRVRTYRQAPVSSPDAAVALGVAVALLPALALSVDDGSRIGVVRLCLVADHVVRGCSRADLQALGRVADAGAGTLVAAVPVDKTDIARAELHLHLALELRAVQLDGERLAREWEETGPGAAQGFGGQR